MVEDEGRQSSFSPGESERIREREPRFASWYASIPSSEHPERNEDQVLIDRQKGVIGVFDGIGGQPSGGEASSKSSKIFRSLLTDTTSTDEALDIFTKGFYVACEALASAEANNDMKKGMATTVTIAQAVKDERGISVAFLHAGDSRLYVVKNGGRLLQVTRDDNLIQQELRSGEITASQAEEFNTRLDNAVHVADLGGARQYWNQRNDVFNQIMAEGASMPLLGVYPVQADDRLLLVTTDGVHDNLTLAEIAYLVQHHKDYNLAKRLVEAAHDTSEKGLMRSIRDDATAVVMKL